VLDRMSGASEAGLQMLCFQGWRDYYTDLKSSREMEEAMLSGEGRMKSLYGKQKGAAKGVVERLNETEHDIFMASIFLSWSCEASLGNVIKHYAGRMDQKKQQLDAVQGMFKNFATALEQGIGQNSPRSQSRIAGPGE